MPTTSNFGWTTPADTDLVKDGAAAIRTLGNGVDTSMAQLKGGTTGQVLSKTSNTDMAFTWVTQDDANAIQNAIVDAKGDLISATANDTPARLAVGNNGDTLLADSSQSVGLRYNPPVGSLGNPVINGGFDIWQRGTSFSAGAAVYTADRWYCYRDSSTAGATFSRQDASDSNLPNIQYGLRAQRNSGNTATQAIVVMYNSESVNSIPYAGKTITLSFYARKGANYSSASDALTVTVATGTGTDQNQYSPGYTGNSNIVNAQTATLTSSWQRFAFTGSVATTAKELGFYFFYTPVGTASTNDWFEVTGVQIDVGTYTASTAPTFRRSGNTLAGELAACQRYYYRPTDGNVYQTFGLGFGTATTTADILCPLPVTMRTAPTTTLDSSSLAISDGVTAYTTGTFTLVVNSQAKNTAVIRYSHGSAALTTYRPYRLEGNNSGTAYFGVSAEL